MEKGALSGVMLAAALVYTSAAAAHGRSALLEPIAPTQTAECDEYNAQLLALRRPIVEAAEGKSDKAWLHAREGPRDAFDRLHAEASLLQEEAFEILMEAKHAKARCLRQVGAYRMAVRPGRHQAASKQDLGNVATGDGGMLASSVSAALQRYGTGGASTEDAAAGTLQRAFRVADRMERAAARRGKFSSVDLRIGDGAPAIDAEALRALRVRLSLAAISHMHARAIGSLGSASSQPGSDRTLGSSVAELLGQAKQDETAILRGGDFRYDMDDVILEASHDPGLVSNLQISLATAEDMISSRSGASEAALKEAAAKEAAAREAAAKEAAAKMEAAAEEEARAKEAARKKEAREVAAVRAAPQRAARGPRTERQNAKSRMPTRCELLLAQIAQFEGLRRAYRAQGFGSLIDWGIRVKRAEYKRGC